MKRTPALLLSLMMLLAACAGADDPEAEPAAAGADDTGAADTDTDTADDGDAAPADPDDLERLVIAEPVHGIGYLPMYVSKEEGFFAEEGLDVEFTTLAGGGHANALLAGEAWAFIGGPESGAVANVRGADTITVANVVNRGNVYLVARPDLDIDIREYDLDEIGEILAGRSIVTGRYGGTPNAIFRHVLMENGLDPATDVELTEVDDSGAILASMAQGGYDFALTTEPQLTQGIDEGIWSEVVFNAPQQLGPYAYSAIVTSRSNLEEDPELAERFIRGLVRGQQLVETDPDRALQIAAAEFPSMDEELMQVTMDRSYTDGLWESSAVDATVVGVALDVARSGAILNDEDDPIATSDMYTPEYVDRVMEELGVS